MASPTKLREFRFKTGTDFHTTYENGAGAAWNAADATAYKLRLTSYDETGLTREGFPDETLQTRMFSLDDPIPGLRKGTYKFSTYCGGAHTNVDSTGEESIMLVCAGGQALPVATRATTIGTNSGTVNIAVASGETIVAAGQAVLVGVKGDARGGGYVYPVSAVATDVINVGVATPVAASSGDAIVFSSTIYPDEDATQRYIDTFLIGHGTGALTQRQTIAGVGKFAITGTAPGELPKTEFDMMTCDHRYVPANEMSTFTQTVVPRGTDPSYDRGIGLVHIGDYGSTTLTRFKCASITFDTGMTYDEVPGPHGLNGIIDYQKVPSTPKLEVTVLIDEDAGLAADFEAGTAKHVIVQLGHAQGKCTAIELPKCYLDAQPTTEDVNNLRGLKLSFHGTDIGGSGTDLARAAFRIHKF